jgi:hypothetical protein
LPGSTPSLLLRGFFEAHEDPNQVILVANGERLLLNLASEYVTQMLLYYHGRCERDDVFQLRKNSDGEWTMGGFHPLVANPEPELRGYSEKYAAIKDQRLPSELDLAHVRDMTPDAVELLHKASQSISKDTSTSLNASIGKVSVITTIPFDPSSQVHMDLQKECFQNSLAMNKLRFVQFSALLVENVFSRVETAFGDVIISEGPITLQSRIKASNCLEVSLGLLTEDGNFAVKRF